MCAGSWVASAANSAFAAAATADYNDWPQFRPSAAATFASRRLGVAVGNAETNSAVNILITVDQARVDTQAAEPPPSRSRAASCASGRNR